MKPKNLFQALSIKEDPCKSSEFKKKEKIVDRWIASEDFKEWLKTNANKYQEICGTDLQILFSGSDGGYINVVHQNRSLGIIYFGKCVGTSYNLYSNPIWQKFVNSIEFDDDGDTEP